MLVGNQLKEQAHEIELMKTAYVVSFVIEDAQTQTLIRQVNEFQRSIQSHENSYALTQLTTKLVGALRAHCNAIIPLASGFYRPHASSAAAVELGHAGGHVVTHGVHHITSLSNHVDTISMGIPILGLAATVYDIWHEHHLLHEAEEAVRKLGVYSDNQRDALYRYVVSCTILTLASSIEGKSLVQCQANILFEIFSCLPKIHACDSIDVLAKNWSESTIHAIQQSGVIMFSAVQASKSITYTKEQLSIAWKVQQIFSDTNEHVVQEHLALPEIKNFLHDVHRRIYQEVLKPYDARANSNVFASFFHGFNAEQLTLVKKHQSYFIHALKVIQDELTPLKEADDPTYLLQLNLINTCLHANLNAMGIAMKWHYAQGLFSEISAVSPSLSCTPCPLTEVKQGSLKIVSIEGQLVEAKADVTAANAQLLGMKASMTQMKNSIDEMKASIANMKTGVSKGSASKTASVTAQGLFAHENQSATVTERLAQLPDDERFTLEDKILYVKNMAAIQAGTTKQVQYAMISSSNQRVDGTLTLGELHTQGRHTFDKPITLDQLKPCLKTMLKLISDKDELTSAQAQARANI